jgi:tRNA (guanine37-N1)-methyltransferase
VFRFDVFTLFPDVFDPYLQTSILQRASQKELIEVHRHDIRDWTVDRHHITDDEPYGGGGGMVMKPEPIFAAVESLVGSPPVCPVILLTPQGRVFTQTVAVELAASAMTSAEKVGTPSTPRLALLCGRYEGVDERVRRYLVSDEISIGDYVITGGELAALVVIDAIARLIPGVLGDPDGAWDDSHASGILEYPHYTRPAEFRGWRVPEVLLSGDHGKIAQWRREQALLRTRQRRPDLLFQANLSQADHKFLASLNENDNQEKAP